MWSLLFSAALKPFSTLCLEVYDIWTKMQATVRSMSIGDLVEVITIWFEEFMLKLCYDFISKKLVIDCHFCLMCMLFSGWQDPQEESMSGFTGFQFLSTRNYTISLARYIEFWLLEVGRRHSFCRGRMEFV